MINDQIAVSSYPKSNFKRDYGRREEISPSRSRAIPEYPSRVHSDRRASYRDEYSSRGSGYPELPRGTHSAARRSYVDDGYGQRFERPPPSYREGRGREYDSVSGSKRPYMAVVSYLHHILCLDIFLICPRRYELIKRLLYMPG